MHEKGHGYKAVQTLWKIVSAAVSWGNCCAPLPQGRCMVFFHSYTVYLFLNSLDEYALKAYNVIGGKETS